MERLMFRVEILLILYFFCARKSRCYDDLQLDASKNAKKEGKCTVGKYYRNISGPIILYIKKKNDVYRKYYRGI